MTDIRQVPTKHSDDYEKRIRSKAPPEAIFEALTSLDGLSAWWVPATGSGEAGGELQFQMNAPEPLVMRVDEATRPTSVRWTVVACDVEPDWVGTHPTFTITPIDTETAELHFRHEGLTPELDCIEECRRGWDHYLESFREYVETGVGMPRGSAGDRARREAEAALG